MLNLKLHTAEKKIQKARRLKTSTELNSVAQWLKFTEYHSAATL